MTPRRHEDHEVDPRWRLARSAMISFLRVFVVNLPCGSEPPGPIPSRPSTAPARRATMGDRRHAIHRRNAMQGHLPVSAETIETLRKVSTDTITGVLMKLAGMRSRAIRDVHPIDPRRCHFVGPAYTLRYVPIREDHTAHASPVSPGSRLHGKLDEIPAGSVLVLDMGGDTTSGALGDVIIARLIALGVAGVVADGGMRDSSVI